MSTASEVLAQWADPETGGKMPREVREAALEVLREVVEQKFYRDFAAKEREEAHALFARERERAERAEAEVERLRRALESMVKDGCGFAPRECPVRSPDPEEWCWSCQARAALRGGGE